MTPAITAGLLHELVTHSHAEGITALDVEAAIEHDDRLLLIVQPGPDFTDDTWQLPAGPVLPGQTLTDALHPAVAAIGHPRQPDRPDQRSRTRRLGRRSRGPEDQPRRSPAQARPARPAGPPRRHRAPGHARPG